MYIWSKWRTTKKHQQVQQVRDKEREFCSSSNCNSNIHKQNSLYTHTLDRIAQMNWQFNIIILANSTRTFVYDCDVVFQSFSMSVWCEGKFIYHKIRLISIQYACSNRMKLKLPSVKRVWLDFWRNKQPTVDCRDSPTSPHRF